MEHLNGAMGTDSTPISDETESSCFGGAELEKNFSDIQRQLDRVDPMQPFCNSDITKAPEPPFQPARSTKRDNDSDVAKASESLFQSARPIKRKNDVAMAAEPIIQSAPPARGRKKTISARPLFKPPGTL